MKPRQSSAGWVAFISSFNALLACGDVLGVALLLFQIPANATVRNQGWRTYWKEHKRVAASVLTALALGHRRWSPRPDAALAAAML